MATAKNSLNAITLRLFAPILVLAGVLGFITPPHLSLMSGATAYNIFHIVFGVIGIIFVLTKNETLIRSFNLGFGLIDLYQAAASFLHLFPEEYFQWKLADDILHIIIGAALVLIGLSGRKSQRALRASR
jgi:hypothetical protein